MAKIDLIDGNWVDLVFEGRNQKYGAYRLRKGTTKRNIISIIVVALIAVIAFAAMAIKNIVEARAKVAATQVTEISALNQPKKQAQVKKQIKIEEPEKVVERGTVAQPSDDVREGRGWPLQPKAHFLLAATLSRTSRQEMSFSHVNNQKP